MWKAHGAQAICKALRDNDPASLFDRQEMFTIEQNAVAQSFSCSVLLTKKLDVDPSVGACVDALNTPTLAPFLSKRAFAKFLKDVAHRRRIHYLAH